MKEEPEFFDKYLKFKGEIAEGPIFHKEEILRKEDKKAYIVKKIKQTKFSKLILTGLIEDLSTFVSLSSELKNPYIIKIEDQFLSNDNLILVESKMTMNLEECMNSKEDVLSPEELRRLICISVYALNDLMVQGKKFHINLKPQNILLDEFHYPRITDFYGIKNAFLLFGEVKSKDTQKWCAPEIGNFFEISKKELLVLFKKVDFSLCMVFTLGLLFLSLFRREEFRSFPHKYLKCWKTKAVKERAITSLLTSLRKDSECEG